MISATATSNASSTFHQHAASSQAAPPVPAITGATALGSVRGRAPSTHCAKLATSAIVPRASTAEVGQPDDEVDRDGDDDRAEEERQQRVPERGGAYLAILDVGVRDLIGHSDREGQIRKIGV